jgi:hypothetical protein
VSGTESRYQNWLHNGRMLTGDRQMSKLSKETDVLTQHNTEVTEALRRIRFDTQLSMDDMRAAIDEVLAMVSGSSIPHSILNSLDTKACHPGRERSFNIQASISRNR